MTIENMKNDVDVDNVNGNIDLKDNIDLNDIVGNAFADVVNGLIRAKVTMLPNGSIHMGLQMATSIRPDFNWQTSFQIATIT